MIVSDLHITDSFYKIYMYIIKISIIPSFRDYRPIMGTYPCVLILPILLISLILLILLN